MQQLGKPEFSLNQMVVFNVIGLGDGIRAMSEAAGPIEMYETYELKVGEL